MGWRLNREAQSVRVGSCHEWGIAGAKAQLLAAGRGTIAGSGSTASLAVERLTYHALLAGLKAFLAEDYVGALTIGRAGVHRSPATRQPA